MMPIGKFRWPWRRRRRRQRTSSIAQRASIVAAAFLVVGLCYAIARTTLADALSAIDPDLTLAISPNHPGALVGKAEALRENYLSGQAKPDGQQAAAEVGAELSANAISVLRTRELRRVEIRELAKRALQWDPLNARAHRLIGEMAPSIDEARTAMSAAVALSRHETMAVYWLLNDSFVRRDWPGTLQHADTLLRTRPQLAAQVHGYLAVLAANNDARPLLVTWLSQPSSAVVASSFLKALPRMAPAPQVPLSVLRELRKSGAAVSAPEVAPYLQHLLTQGFTDLARSACRELLEAKCGDSNDGLNNGDFETDPSGAPFDWQLGRGRGSVAELRPRAEGKGTALHLTFGLGRSRLSTIRQDLTLSPGPYTFSIAYSGALQAKRGLVWQLACLYGKRQVVMRTDMVMHEPRWRIISQSFSIPEDESCRAQVLRLLHDARSASEELIEGEAWFDDAKISRGEAPQ